MTAVENAAQHLNAAARLARTLRLVAWAGLVVGLVVVGWTWAENHDAFGPAGVSSFLLGMLVPLVTGWGVLLGFATLIELRVDAVLIEGDE